MSTFFHTKTLKEEIRRFRVKLDIWNEDKQRMELFVAEFEGHTSDSETKWEGRTKNPCYSEGLQAAVYALEYALARARDAMETSKNAERKSLSTRRRNV